MRGKAVSLYHVICHTFFFYKKQVQHEKINCKKISDTDINVRTNCYQKITSFLIFLQVHVYKIGNSKHRGDFSSHLFLPQVTVIWVKQI